jgi:hypothetical protein
MITYNSRPVALASPIARIGEGMSDYSDRLTMAEIRAFLLKSDAVEEVEGILVDSMLKRSHDSSTALRRPVVKRPADDDVANLQTASGASIDAVSRKGNDSSSNRLDYLKIHDMLPSIDNGGTTRARSNRTFISNDQRPQQEMKALFNQQPNKSKLLELQSIEESTAEEFSELQSRRDRVVSTRSELHPVQQSLNRRRPHRQVRPFLPLQHHAQGHVEQEVNTKNKASMTQLFDLTQQHAMKLALSSVESMEYQRELDLIRAGHWSIDKSDLRNATRASSSLRSHRSRRPQR